LVVSTLVSVGTAFVALATGVLLLKYHWQPKAALLLATTERLVIMA